MQSSAIYFLINQVAAGFDLVLIWFDSKPPKWMSFHLMSLHRIALHCRVCNDLCKSCVCMWRRTVHLPNIDLSPSYISYHIIYIIYICFFLGYSNCLPQIMCVVRQCTVHLLNIDLSRPSPSYTSYHIISYIYICFFLGYSHRLPQIMCVLSCKLAKY